jgi:hypothetical protein
MNSIKIEQIHIVSVLNKSLEPLGETPPCTETLLQVKYPREKFKKNKGAIKRKIFNLTDTSSSDNSSEA